MRLALISDLHGNEVALRAVLKSARAKGVDQVVCLGDVATLGPRPRAILDLLRELRCVCILGNHDEFLVDPTLLGQYTEAPFIVQAIDWCRDQLSPEDLAFVRTFQRDAELPLEGGASLYLFHGSPKSHMVDLLATTPADALDELLGDRRATVMAGGHTHVQMLRQHRGVWLVNPGSVGLPFKEYVAGRAPQILPHAEYATVESTGSEVSVTLHRVDLDKDALRAAARESTHPMKGMLLAQYA
ncbi:MAG: metallophosphoesterase family protein [Myxococcaceae bacterium]